MKKRYIVSALAVAALVSAGLLQATVAQATSADSSSESTTARAEQPAKSANAENPAKHCAVRLDAVPKGEPKPAGVIPEEQCFDTFSEAVTFGTHGAVQLPLSATPGSIDLREASTAADTLLGVLYGEPQYDGGSRSIYGEGRGCYAGRTYYVDDFGDIGFNDKASSFKVRSNCIGRLYKAKNQDGDTFLCESNCPGLGDLNNESSSVKFF